MSKYNKEKYYWLKLKRDFFKRHDIQIVESMPNGKDYILFYLKLLCESVDHKGHLRFNDEIPYNEAMLSTITNTNIDIVRSAIKVFASLKMLEVYDDGTYYMKEVEKMIGSQSISAEKKQMQRNQKNSDGGHLSVVCPPEKDIDKEKYIEIEEKKISKRKEKEKTEEVEEILDYWNKKQIIVHKKLTEIMADAILKVLKTYTKEEILTAIDRYALMYQDKEYELCHYKWGIIEFLKQNNALPTFLDEGSKWLSYQEFLRKTQKQEKTQYENTNYWFDDL